MSEVLRAPWLLQTVLDDLSNDETNQSGLNHLHMTPKLVQIIQFMKSGADSTHMLAHLSDKFHYIVSFFSDKALRNFGRKHPNWSIMDIQGAIIRVLEYRIVKVPCPGDAEVRYSIVLVVEEFDHVGSDGSSVFGDPRYVPINPAVRVSLQRPAPPSPSKADGMKSQEYSFTQSLDPNDLLFLESTCTQTFQRQFVTFPQVISDSDWKIPAEQVKILEGIKLTEIETFEYEAGSDVELSEDESEKAKRAKVTFPLTQASLTSGTVSQTTMTQTAMSQMFATQVPFTQAPMTQASSQSLPMQTQSPLHTETVIFPETQHSSSNSAILGVTQSSPIRISKLGSERSPMKNSMSGPIKSTASPIKSTASPIKSTVSPMQTAVAVSPVRNTATPIKFSSVNRGETPLISEVIKTTIEMAEIPSSPINSPVKKSSDSTGEAPEPIIEYPDYSSW